MSHLGCRQSFDETHLDREAQQPRRSGGRAKQAWGEPAAAAPAPKPQPKIKYPKDDGKPWGESAFVPMSSVSTPTNFFLEPLADDGSGNDVYTIMPATFEPGKVGSFFLSVVADCEFMLKRDTSTDRKPRN